MAYTLVLVFHILVACATMIAIAYSAYVLMREKFPWFEKLAAFIAACAVLETVSGFALAALSPTATVLSVSFHLLWYLGLCLIAEAALLLNTRRVWIG